MSVVSTNSAMAPILKAVPLYEDELNYFEALPEELLGEIVQYLSFRDGWNLRATCTWLYSAVPEYIRSVDFSGDDFTQEERNMVDEHFLEAASACSDVSALRLPSCHGIFSPFEEYFCGNKFQKLEEVDLSYCLLRDVGLNSLLKGREGKMRILKLRGCTDLTDLSVSNISNCQRLEVLDLGMVRKATDSSFVSLLANLRQITDIKFDGCDGLSDSAFERFHLKEVSSMILDGCMISGNTLNILSRRARKLESLSLKRCDRIEDSAFLSLQEMSSLRTLDISHCNVSDSDFQLVSLPNVRSLAIRNTMVTATAISCICSYPSLTSLDVSNCYRLKDSAVHALTSARNLSTLHAENLNHITTDGWALLAASKSLTALDVSGCRSITPNVVSQFASEMKLESLRMSRCDYSLIPQTAAMVARISSIRELDCSESVAVTSLVLKNLHSSRCLESVNVLGCTNLCAKSVEDFKSALPKVKIISSPFEVEEGGGLTRNVSTVDRLSRLDKLSLAARRRITDVY